jgi:hypothetical protein
MLLLKELPLWLGGIPNARIPRKNNKNKNKNKAGPTQQSLPELTRRNRRTGRMALWGEAQTTVTFINSTSDSYKEKEMTNFRKWSPVLAVVALMIGAAATANAQQVAAFSCVGNAGVRKVWLNWLVISF